MHRIFIVIRSQLIYKYLVVSQVRHGLSAPNSALTFRRSSLILLWQYKARIIRPSVEPNFLLMAPSHVRGVCLLRSLQHQGKMECPPLCLASPPLIIMGINSCPSLVQLDAELLRNESMASSDYESGVWHYPC